MFFFILVTKPTTEEVKNATTDNNEMYGEENDPLTILQDEKRHSLIFRIDLYSFK